MFINLKENKSPMNLTILHYKMPGLFNLVYQFVIFQIIYT